MHGITRCPQCKTAFNVVHKHLFPANGKVRCGACKHTFNAADHWVVADVDDADLDFERPTLSLQTSTKSVWQSLTLGLIITISALMVFIQWLHKHPSITNHLPELEQPRLEMYRWLSQTAPSPIDWSKLELRHYIAQTHPDNPSILRVQGLIINHSKIAQPQPDLLLSIQLADGTVHDARIAQEYIVRKQQKLRGQRQSQFYFDIDRPRQAIETFSLAMCCQQKN